MIWTNGIGVFFRLWKPLAVYLLSILVLFVWRLSWTCFRLRLPPAGLLGRLWKSILIGLTTASSAAAFGAMIEINEKKLGIPPKLSRFGTSLSNQLVSELHSSILVVILYYLAEQCSVPVSFGWFLTAWLMCSVLGITVPPVSGGMLAVTGVILNQLNIPLGGLAAASLLSIILDFFGTGVKVGISHLDIIEDADYLRMWDRMAPERVQ